MLLRFGSLYKAGIFTSWIFFHVIHNLAFRCTAATILMPLFVCRALIPFVIWLINSSCLGGFDFFRDSKIKLSIWNCIVLVFCSAKQYFPSIGLQFKFLRSHDMKAIRYHILG